MTAFVGSARRLFCWWLDESLRRLPGWLTAAGDVPAAWRLDGNELVPVTRTARGGRGKPWSLVLDAAPILTLHRLLPLTALAQLRPLVGLQLGHWSPLPADAALFTTNVERVGPDGAQVRIDILSRAVLRGAEAAAERQGLGDLRGIRVPTSHGTVDFPVGNPPSRRVPPRLMLLLLALLAVPLVLAILQESQRWQLSAEVGAGRVEAEQVRSLGQRTARARAQALAAVVARREAPVMVLMLDHLSGLLPDDAYLTELRLEDGRAHLLGYAREGAALPALLEASPQFEDARFEAALLRAGPKGDRFHLSVKVSDHATP